MQLLLSGKRTIFGLIFVVWCLEHNVILVLCDAQVKCIPLFLTSKRVLPPLHFVGMDPTEGFHAENEVENSLFCDLSMNWDSCGKFLVDMHWFFSSYLAQIWVHFNIWGWMVVYVDYMECYLKNIEIGVPEILC